MAIAALGSIQGYKAACLIWCLGCQNLSQQQPFCACSKGFQLAQLKPAPPSPLLVEAVRSKAALADFLTLLSPYDAQAQHFYQRMHTPAHFTAAETLFVGYHQGQPVTIATLWQQQTQATIFSLISQPSQQRQGFGTAMMHFLMHQAAQQGAQFLSLSASGATNLRLYQKLGFQKYGEFACYESGHELSAA
jgi:ribosomal protein S18 acetylase RimI-like enzyme